MLVWNVNRAALRVEQGANGGDFWVSQFLCQALEDFGCHVDIVEGAMGGAYSFTLLNGKRPFCWIENETASHHDHLWHPPPESGAVQNCFLVLPPA